MNRMMKNQRNIKFFSEKNDAALTVCSERMKHYASLLENDYYVIAYRVHEAFNMSELSSVGSIDIRTEYMDVEAPAWASDFWIEFEDGSRAIRELVDETMLKQRSFLERLELSRRYWAVRNITDWKAVVINNSKVVKKEAEDDYVF